MKGIPFKPDMIKAIVDLRKTVTRRLDGLKEINQSPKDYFWSGAYFYHEDGKEISIKSRYAVGEVVYIKEAWWEDSGDIYYKADCPTMPTNMFFEKGKWKSPLFLPEIFARTFIQITDVRPERLNSMTENDAHIEGVDNLVTFMLLWDRLNKKRGYEWKKNCWVWVLEFQKV